MGQRLVYRGSTIFFKKLQFVIRVELPDHTRYWINGGLTSWAHYEVEFDRAFSGQAEHMPGMREMPVSVVEKW